MNARASMLMIWLLCSAGIAQGASDRAHDLRIVPAPANVQLGSGTFTVQARTQLVTDDDPRVQSVAHYFGDLLAHTRQIRPDIVTEQNAASLKKVMRFTLRKGGIAVDPESYQLDISSAGIVLSAQDPRGLFYGATTLWQLLCSDEAANDDVRVPALHIDDTPRLRWRGLMLDSAHQYQPVEFIKHFVDVMALHKLNVLHWYLADDNAWRIEIHKYPKLTAGVPRGEMYSQTQISEMVAYAAQRNVTIVPGIAMPAHAGAMIAAYPHLGALMPAPPGDATQLLNADESTFGFLDDVFDELARLFPGEYVHIGSADFPTSQWHASARIQIRMRELGLIDEQAMQGYFVERVTTIARTHQRRIAGWGLTAAGTSVLAMSSHGLDDALSATAAGNEVVVGSFEQLDFNHAQSIELGAEPQGIAPIVRVEDVYGFDPAPVALGAEDLRHLNGVQANIWTQHLRTTSDIEVVTFPRAAALAEIAWSPYARQRWTSFVPRLVAAMKLYDRLGISYSDASFRVSFTIRPVPGATERAGIELSQQVPSGEIRYTTDGSEPTARSPMYMDILDVRPPLVMKAATFLDGERLSTTSRMELAKDSLVSRN